MKCWLWMMAGLDDRNDDSSSLGDWYVNEEKLNGGLKHLVDEVNKLGIKIRYLV